ncbi:MULTISPECIES: hypothetical protein [unclassified Ruegeria]|uniref:hypothetical protein n=1 Tax=unclassified Ruegeria TaxID=2625375 RepID=UPI0014891448|nr:MULTISPECIES: hypothetical protein [unclassified Ruegeria]
MSRILLIVAIAAIGAGAYYYLNQPEPTPAEELQSAAQDAAEAAGEATEAARQAVSDALDSAVDQATETAEAAQNAVTNTANAAADQISEGASSVGTQVEDAATEAGDQIAALSQQGQDLFNSWIEDGTLTTGQFDYDSMVASVRDSALAQEIKTQAIVILDEIKASPETLVTKMQELQQLLTQPQ